MSKTFTSRPSVTSRSRGATRGQSNQANPRGGGRGTTRSDFNLRGRGRGLSLSSQPVSRPSGRGSVRQSTRGAMYSSGARSRGMDPARPGEMGRSQGDGETEGAVGGQDTRTQDERMSYQSGYSVLTPNEKRRRQISEQARRETEEYERHKAENKPHHVSYHGTVGGGQMTQEQARRQLIQKNTNTKYNMLEKQRMYREERKRQEDSVYEKKKLEAREKTEANKRRALREEDAKRDEMERIKNAFLDRMEKSQKKPQASAINSANQTANPASHHLSMSHDHQSLSPPAVSELIERRQSEPTQLEDSNMTEEMNSDLQTLHSMFPQYSMSAIAEIYKENCSLELTAEILSDS